MNRSDFVFIKRFTPEEIECTGANVEDVDFASLKMLDRLAILLGTPVYLIAGGITTGNHKSEYHKKGRAFDFHLGEITHETAVRVSLWAVYVGFRGVGIYINAKGAYSFHVDSRTTLSTWMGIKTTPRDSWQYESLRFNIKGAE